MRAFSVKNFLCRGKFLFDERELGSVKRTSFERARREITLVQTWEGCNVNKTREGIVLGKIMFFVFRLFRSMRGKGKRRFFRRWFRWPGENSWVFGNEFERNCLFYVPAYIPRSPTNCSSVVFSKWIRKNVISVLKFSLLMLPEWYKILLLLKKKGRKIQG